MTDRMAPLNSSVAVRARLQAALFRSRERRLARKGATAAIPVISSARAVGRGVSVVGVSVSGALIIVYIDGVEGARTRADGSGDWSLTVEGLSSGAHDFTATATSFGGTSAATVAEGVVIA